VTLYAAVLRYPDLYLNLFRREVNVRYKGSLLGVGWTFVNPLVLMGVYTLVFSVLWRAANIAHYPLFIISGLAIWMFFSGSIQMASGSLLGRANLIKQVKFPRQLVPLAVVGSNLVTYAAMLAVIAIANLIVIPATRSTMWAVIPLSIPLLALASGLSIVLAALTVLFRDVEHLLLTILLPWFFLTPILWSVSTLPEKAQRHPRLLNILEWGNPIAPPIAAVRDALWSGHLPRAADVIYLVVAAAVALLLGAVVFRSVDDRIAVEL
jgi:ABC-type polysaccharide/polyol phosphate export permease